MTELNARPAADRQPESPSPFSWVFWRTRVGFSLVFNTLIALLFTALAFNEHDFGTSFVINFVYSQLIGLCILLAIEIPRCRWFPGHQITHPWRLVLLIVSGVIVGLVVGGALAAHLLTWWVGATFYSPLAYHERFSLGVLVLSATATLVASILMMQRVRLASYGQRLAVAETQLAQAQQAASQAQLKTLQAQLEPHMLFNTLANLKVLIDLDPAAAQAMLDALIRFLRATLSASQVVERPLVQEFETLRDYLALMQVRMGPRLQVELTLPPELATINVPSLLLQPLVENAVRHGLEPSVQGGTVRVEAKLEPQYHDDGTLSHALLLVVADDGVGCAPAGDDTDGTVLTGFGQGFGTRQIQERLTTLYGANASWRVRGPGYRVELRLPFQTV